MRHSCNSPQVYHSCDVVSRIYCDSHLSTTDTNVPGGHSSARDIGPAVSGGARGDRTPDLLTASQALIPTELWPHALVRHFG